MKSLGKTTQPQAADTLTGAGNWSPENLALIDTRLKEISGSKPATTPVAVFDFDNTCVFRDVGQAVFRYQLLQMRYRLTPEQLAAILPAMQGDLAGRPMEAIISTLMDAYRQLWPLIASRKAQEARLLPEYRLFTTLLLWFIDKARKDERLGPRYVLPFMGKLLAGYSRAELRRFAAEVVTTAMTEPLIEETLRLDAPKPLGHLEASYPLGLHAHQEMQTLMQRLQQQGIDCYVISASTEWLVEEAAQLLDFPVAADHIFGIRVGLDDHDLLTTEDFDSYPITFREGKAEIIRRFIDGTPVLVAGDADTDFEMLTLPGVALRLLINRNQSGLISTLYQDPHILLQGLDLRTGRFRPFRESLGS
jgi:phosphoserine phosphatase